MSSSAVDLWEEIALDAEREGSLWREALRPRDARDRVPVFSPLTDDRFGLAVETIYEGYLVHYGQPRLFAPDDRDTILLLWRALADERSTLRSSLWVRAGGQWQQRFHQGTDEP